MDVFKKDKYEKEKTIKEYEKNREQQIIKRFEEDCYNNEKIIKPFSEIFKDIIGEDTYVRFERKTGLGKSMFYALQNRVGKDEPTSKGTVVSICVGYDMGLTIAKELLESQGSSFNPHSQRDTAYKMLLTEFRGKKIDECNKILKEIGIPEKYWLGNYTKKPRKPQEKK